MIYILLGVIAIIFLRWFAAAVLGEVASYLIANRRTHLVPSTTKLLRAIGAKQAALELERDMWEQRGALANACDAAVALYEASLSQGPCLNLAGNAAGALVWAGRYEQAVTLVDSALERAGRETRMHEIARVLPLLNSAEALYNRGLWTEALTRLEGLDAAVARSSYEAAWLTLQRAWILAHSGRGSDALTLAESVSLEAVKRPYAAEVYFTRAAALLSLGRLADAEAAVRTGMEAAVRPSSERNGCFLLGRVLVAARKLEDAEQWFRRGAEHHYRGQGGDGLLAWGDCLASLGRLDEAQRAWELAIERDSQSASAGLAAERLARENYAPAQPTSRASG